MRPVRDDRLRPSGISLRVDEGFLPWPPKGKTVKMKAPSTTALLVLLILAVPSHAAGQDGQTEILPGHVSAVGWDHMHVPPFGEAYLRVEKALRCSCGCMLDPHLCQAQMQCGTSPVWSQRILELLEQGESEEVILAGFVSEFGPSVLMTPPLEGFSWVGYFLPWLAILAMTAAVGTTLRRWVPQTDRIPVRNELSLEELERIRKEIDRMEAEERELGF